MQFLGGERRLVSLGNPFDGAAAAEPPSLDGIDMLESLSWEERDRVAALCRWQRFRAGDTVLDQDGDGCDVCFVVQGAVRIVSYSYSGREVSFDDVAAGGVVGEMAAIDGQPRSASVEALEPGTLIAFLSGGAFLSLATGHPQLALALMRRLAGMVRRCTERIVDLSTLGAANRVQSEILRLAVVQGGERGNTAVIRPIPVHADLAARVGTTRETVARVLGDMARDGFLERRSGEMVVHDLARLRALVEEVRG